MLRSHIHGLIHFHCSTVDGTLLTPLQVQTLAPATENLQPTVPASAYDLQQAYDDLKRRADENIEVLQKELLIRAKVAKHLYECFLSPTVKLFGVEDDRKDNLFKWVEESILAKRPNCKFSRSQPMMGY